jgi:elongator complex protein 1
VGWGKKETQFHGTEGKAARVRAAERGTLSPWDDGRVRVVWRGDGQMLAVSYVTSGEEPVRNVLPLARARIMLMMS